MSGGSWFYLKVYAEDGVFYEGKCLEVILPCVDGEKAFLPHHEDAVYAVYNGTMRYLIPAEEAAKERQRAGEKAAEADGTAGEAADARDPGGADRPSWREAVIGKGVTNFINNRCTILVETAERPEDIDANRAQRALERAQEKMQRELSMREYRISQMAMARATARIRAAAKKD